MARISFWLGIWTFAPRRSAEIAHRSMPSKTSVPRWARQLAKLAAMWARVAFGEWFSCFVLLGWRDADGVGSAGADGPAVGGLELLGEADFDGGEVIVAATEGEGGAGDGGVGFGEEVE